MKTKIVAIIVAVFAISVVLAGCGASNSTTGTTGGGAAGNTAQQRQGIIDSWELVSEKHGSETRISEEDLEVIRSLGFDVYAFVTDEGDFYWDIGVDTYYSKLEKQEAANFTSGMITFENSVNTTETFDAGVQLEDDTLTIDVDGYIYKFRRMPEGGGVSNDVGQYTRDNYIGDYWVVNGNAIIELSGEELYWLLWYEDYVWNEESGAEVRTEPYGIATLSAYGPGGNNLTTSELRALNAGGQDNSVVYAIQCSDFESAEKAFETCFNKTAPELVYNGGVYVTTVSSSSGNDYLVLINPEKHYVMISGAGGLSILSEALGRDLGSSISEAYGNLAEDASAS